MKRAESLGLARKGAGVNSIFEKPIGDRRGTSEAM